MKSRWMLGTLLALACSGGTDQNGKPAPAVVDECHDGQSSSCTVDGRPGTRACAVGEHGFVWGACMATPQKADTCKPGDSYHCFAEGSFQRQQFGDMLASCQQINGQWTYPPESCSTPLVLAFDDQPVELTRAPGSFDLFGQGMSIATDWVSAKTPWLVLDRDHDGNIADGSELFGSMTLLPDGARASNGFSALAALDADADGWITARDPAFARLQLWSDADQNRRSSAAELRSLASLRVEALELSNHVVPRCSPSGCELERARFVFRDQAGAVREGALIDVHLRGF